MSFDNNPLGIFDSGIGGLTVLKKVLEELPYEDVIYLGDTARVPYGDKTPQAILNFSLENASFLQTHQVKLLIVACNTASAYAVDELRKRFSIPVIDVIEPAVDLAVETSNTKKIAVLGTRATIQSGIYSAKIQQQIPEADVFSIHCPLFVPLVEEEFLNHPATEMIVQEYLKPIIDSEIDTVILGCTHYPLLMQQIQKVLKREVKVIDSASVCAKKVVQELEKKQLKKNSLKVGTRKYYASDDTEKLQRLGEKFLGLSIQQVIKI